MRRIIKKVIAGSLGIFLIMHSMLNVQAAPHKNTMGFEEYLDTDSGVFVGREDTNTSEYSQMKSEPEMIYVSSIDGSNRVINFDSNWRFYFGNVEEASKKNFSDARWTEVNLPHDYSITQEYNRSLEAESAYLPGGIGWYRKNFNLPSSLEGKSVQLNFDGVYMDATIWVNGHRIANHPYGYTPFTMDISEYLEYGADNVIAVKVNHQTPSSRWYSGSGIYRSVHLIVKDKVHIVEDGVKISYSNLETDRANTNVTVRADFKNDTDANKNLSLQYILKEKNSDTVIAEASSVSQDVTAGAKQTVETEFVVNNPVLWQINDPHLYTLTTKLLADGEVVDRVDTDFGFRFYHFHANEGFSFNGQRMKLKGVCLHHDQGSLGAVAYEDAMRRQIEILKEMGCNSIRITHNPGAKRFIELCDEIGMLVIEEAFDGWHQIKNTNNKDYSRFFDKAIGAEAEHLIGARADMTWAEYDIKSMIRRDFNSPSIIMWSIGNEVDEGTNRGVDSSYIAHARNLTRWSKEEDSTRMVTFGDNKLKGGVNPSNPHGIKAENLSADGGVIGVNYMDGTRLDAWHRAKPNWLLYESETASSVNSRGIYKISGYNIKNSYNQLTSYDESTVPWGKLASQAWYDVITRDFNAGEYVWTGFDYLGEPTLWNGTDGGAKGGNGGGWPAPKNSFFGIIDTAGLPKDSYYLYRSLWNTDSKTLHILPAWKENVVEVGNDGKVKVVVYSNAKAVRLQFTPDGSDQVQDLGLKVFTEKQSMGGAYTYQLYEGEGRSRQAHQNLYLTWKVPYRNGKLEAIAYSDENGTQVIENTVGQRVVRTPGAAAKLLAKVYNGKTTLKADGTSLAYVEIDVTDADGNLVPDADNPVQVQVGGAGRLVAMDNGNSVDHTPYQNSQRSAFNGKLIAIVQSTTEAGEIRINLTSDGLEGQSIILHSESVQDEDLQKKLVSYKLSRNYYIKKGSSLQLDTQVQTYYSDGEELTQNVEWENIPDAKLETAGSFRVKGHLPGGEEVIAKVYVIDKIAAVLNYSDSVELGKTPILPDSRPGVLSGGVILDVSFPVTWENKPDDVYTSTGVVQIQGQADVFGEPYAVTANIRVAEEDITLGESVSSQAMRLTSYQGGKEHSDILDAVKDNSYVSGEAQDSQWRNLSRWSNWLASREGVNEASLTFQYATQFRLGEVSVYFVRDNVSLRFPDAGTTSIDLSEDGITWNRLQATEEIAEQEISPQVKKYTYHFTPTTATFVRINIRNAERTSHMTSHVSTGITEIELRNAQGSFALKNTARLERLSINGHEVAQSALLANSYGTQALFVDEIQMQTMDNAAATYIPSEENQKEAYIYIESEDHRKQELFTIRLDVEKSYPDADFAERDYDYRKTTVEAGNEEPRERAVRAVDGNISTMWHTNWNHTTTLEERNIVLTMQEETQLDGLRYLARSTGGDNGRVKKYAVDVWKDNNWVEVATGEWENQAGYHSANFSPVSTNKVRLRGIETYNSGHAANRFMSAVEIRLRQAEPMTDINREDIRITMPNKYIKVQNLSKPVKPQIEVRTDNGLLRYGLDYRIRYEQNDRPGKAKAVVEGIESYGGSKELTFYIVSDAARTLSVEDADIYLNDEKLETKTASIEPGQEVELRWDDTVVSENAFWQVIPHDFSYEKVQESLGNARIKFRMPDYSLHFKVKQIKAGERNLFGYVQTSPSDWFATVDEDILTIALDARLTVEEQQRVLDGEIANFRLSLTKTEHKPAVIATSSDASEVDTKAFYVAANAAKQIGSDDFVTLEDAVSLPVRIEVPKKDRNMSDYQVVAFDKSGESEPTVVPNAYEDGFLRFMLDTNFVYGVYYNKTVEVEFVDFDDRVLVKVYVKPGQIPSAPQNPEREGYEFVKWSKELRPVYANTTYQAIYKKDDTGLWKAKYSLEGYLDLVKVAFETMRISDYDEVKYRALENMIAQVELALDNENLTENKCTSFKKKLKALYEDLVQSRRVREDSLPKTEDRPRNEQPRNDQPRNDQPRNEQPRNEQPRNETPKSKQPQRGSSGGSGGGSGRSSISTKLNKLSQNAKQNVQKSEQQPLLPSVELKGNWQKSGNKWQFKDETGAVVKNRWAKTMSGKSEVWYIFDNNGELVTGWYQSSDRKWYYLNEEKTSSEGQMITGWVWVTSADYKQRCYYLNADGVLLQNTVTPDGYQVNANGEWVVGGLVQTK